jgi:hypothetical protein
MRMQAHALSNLSKKIYFLGNGFSLFFDRIAKKIIGKELAIGIGLGFVLMSFLMLIANNLGPIDDLNPPIHAIADID